MKILVTGGAGFIASHIVDAYILAKHDVAVIDNLSSGKREFVNKNAKLYEIDIRNTRDTKRVLRSFRPDVINHHAAQISVRKSVEDPHLDAEVNIIGLLNLLESARNVGVKKIIFASSGGVVYGEADQIPTPENYHPLQPLSPYGISKLTSEYYLHFYYKAHKMPYIAFRYGNVYGPRQNPHGEAGVVAIFTLKLLNNETPIINGNGKQTRDYISIRDVVAANVLALNSSEVGAFNIGTGKETSVLQLYESLIEIVGKSVKAKFGPPKTGEQNRSCLYCERARQVLNWMCIYDLKKGLSDTVHYFKKYEKK